MAMNEIPYHKEGHKRFDRDAQIMDPHKGVAASVADKTTVFLLKSHNYVTNTEPNPRA